MFVRLVALSFAAVVFLAGAPGFAEEEQGAMVRMPVQNVVLPFGSLMSFSLSNLRRKNSSSDTAQPASCENVSGKVWFLGGTTGADSTVLDTNGAQSLKLLDEIDFDLAAGKTLSLEFQQPFPDAQTVIVQGLVPPNKKHCLAASSATINRSGGDFLAIVPKVQVAVGDYIDVITLLPGEPSVPVCFPCAPVCGCGTE